jgi:hypothetical protein
MALLTREDRAARDAQGGPYNKASRSGEGLVARLRRRGRGVVPLALRMHRLLAVTGALGLLLWGGSGLLHLVMTNFGPQPRVFAPPVAPLDLSTARSLAETLAAAGIERAAAVRVVASKEGSLLQVTEAADRPRRYFRLESGEERPGYDAVQAEFLARHYLAADEPLRSIEWIDEFSDDYPWVNRLLPVYRIEFQHPDRLTAYVYTETGVLAAVTNDLKQILQTGFSWLHTWSWLPRQAEWLRVGFIALMIGSLFSLSLSGSVLLVGLRGRTGGSPVRRIHRRSAWLLALPLLMLSGSALYHLVAFAGVTPGRSLTLSPPIEVADASFPIHEQWREISEGLDVSSVSIVEDGQGRILYRLGLARGRGPAPATAVEIRNARFDGIPRTGPAVYVDAATGRAVDQGDRELALQLGERFTGLGPERLEGARLVTRFGPLYDFRNKRLPVWRLDYGDPLNASIFVDTTTGVLADRLDARDVPERLVFSFLHKWNFLFPFGRRVQSAVVATVVAASMILMAGLGWRLHLARR